MVEADRASNMLRGQSGHGRACGGVCVWGGGAERSIRGEKKEREGGNCGHGPVLGRQLEGSVGWE